MLHTLISQASNQTYSLPLASRTVSSAAHFRATFSLLMANGSALLANLKPNSRHSGFLPGCSWVDKPDRAEEPAREVVLTAQGANHTRVSVCARVCACVHMCLCACVHMCVCVHACVCACANECTAEPQHPFCTSTG